MRSFIGARSATRRVMSVGLSIGSRLPAYCTSMGRVLLAAMSAEDLTDRAALVAELERVRERGFAVVDEELEIGLRSIAAPVRLRSGRVAAAMNTGVHAARVS